MQPRPATHLHREGLVTLQVEIAGHPLEDHLVPVLQQGLFSRRRRRRNDVGLMKHVLVPEIERGLMVKKLTLRGGVTLAGSDTVWEDDGAATKNESTRDRFSERLRYSREFTEELHRRYQFSVLLRVRAAEAVRAKLSKGK